MLTLSKKIQKEATHKFHCKNIYRNQDAGLSRSHKFCTAREKA